MRWKNLRENIYKIYITLKLEYCSNAWSSWTLSDRDTREKVEQRAVGMVTTLPRGMSYAEKLNILGLTSLVEHRDRGDMIQMFRCLGGQDSVGYEPFFTLEIEAQRDGPPTRARSGHLNVVPPAPARTEQRRNFWSQRSVLMWNSLNNQAKMATNVNMLKNIYNKEISRKSNP